MGANKKVVVVQQLIYIFNRQLHENLALLGLDYDAAVSRSSLNLWVSQIFPN